MEKTESGNGKSTLTKAQHEIRKQGIGASEVAAVLGVDPFRNALDVFLEKTGQVEPFAGNEFTEWGNRLEGVIAEAYADRMGVVLRRSDTVVSPDADWMLCTPDRLVGADRGVEVKNRNYFNWREWGEPGTDEVPIEVAAQVHWSMMVTRLPCWDVAVLLGGNRLGIYHLKYDVEVADDIVNEVYLFWHDYVLPRITPPLDGSGSASNYLNSKWKLYGQDLKAPSDEILDYALALKDVRTVLKTQEEAKKRLENFIKDFIGDDMGIEIPDGGGKITWKRPKASRKTDWRAVAEGLKKGRHKLLARLLDEHTEEREATRRFLCQFQEG